MIAAVAGLTLGFLLFSHQTEPNKETKLQPNQTNTPIKIVSERSPVKTTVTDNLPNSESTDNEEVKRLQNTISEQAEKIELLQQSLAQLQLSQSASSETRQSIQTISMQDFEDKLKGSFRDRFKGYAIEITGEQLDEFHKVFQKEQKRSQWSAEYENYINEFIQNNDPDGLQYVEEVYCNQAMCRLKIQSSDEQQWQQLYSSMTQQKWFNSMTLVEKSDIPGTLIYYIPKPGDF